MEEIFIEGPVMDAFKKCITVNAVYLYDLFSIESEIRNINSFKVAEIHTYSRLSPDGDEMGLYDICMRDFENENDKFLWWVSAHNEFGLFRINGLGGDGVGNENAFFGVREVNAYLIMDESKFNYFMLIHPKTIQKIFQIHLNENH